MHMSQWLSLVGSKEERPLKGDFWIRCCLAKLLFSLDLQANQARSL